MYQFPDSTGNNITPPHHSQPNKINKKKHVKFIIVANVLLAFFVISIAWFLFFFDSNTNVSISKLAITQTNDQNSLKNFTPVIIKNNEESISNSTVKNIRLQTITKPTIPEQKAEKNKIKAAIKSAVNINKQPENISAIDAITQELEKNRLKTQKTHPKTSTEKNNYTELNQVTIEKSTDTVLKKALQETTKKLSNSEYILIEQLKRAISQSSTDKDQEKNTSNSDIHNSISLQKSKDIDKIMAAMGSIKNTPLTTSIENIENKVKHLLSSTKDKYRKTDLYEKKLEPESKLNSNEMRILTVKKGEAIWDIAVRAYGDGNKYKKILDANPLIKNNPALLKAGVTLRAPL